MAVNIISGSSKGGNLRNTTITGSSKGGDLSKTIKPRTEEVSTNSGSKSGSGSGLSDAGAGLNGSLSGSGYFEGGYGGGGSDYESMIASLIAQQRAAAENAYNNSMGRLNEAWNINENALKSNLDSTLNRLKSQYDYSSGVVNDDANKSLREAYVNYMLNKKNMNQGLTAMGLSGGATESNMAKMYNNYGSSRNNINTQLAENLANLLNEYQGNVANANQLYNSQRADAWNQRMSQQNSLEASLANALTNLYTGGNLSQYANYASTLAGLSASPQFNNGGYATSLANINNTGEYTPTTNTLALNNISTTAANNMGSVTDYAKWKAMADSLSGAGANTSNIIYQLRQNGAPLDAVYQILGA